MAGNPKPCSSLVVFVAKQFDATQSGDWYVEGINYELSCVYYTLFTGLETEKQAKEYAEWQNNKVKAEG